MTKDSTPTVWQRMSGRFLARIGKNALALLIAQAGAKLLNLALAAQLARTLGVAALGRYLLALTVEMIALAIADLGINVYTVREFARSSPSPGRRPMDPSAWSAPGEGRHSGGAGGGHCRSPKAYPRIETYTVDRETKGNTRERQELWGTVLVLKLLAALCATLVLNAIVAPLFFPGERRALIAIASLALLPETLNGLATALIKARQRMEISSAIHLAIRLAAAGAGMLLLRSGGDERLILFAYVAANLLGSCAFVALLCHWRVRMSRGRVRLSGWGRRWRTVLREAVPFAVTGMVAILYSRLDLLMLAHWQSDRAAGLYGSAHRVWEALGMIPASLLDALFPELSRVGADAGNHAHLHALYRRARTLIWLLIALVAVPCFVLAPRLMALLYGQSADTAIAGALFRALLFAFPFTYLYLLNGHLLYAIGQQLWVTRAMIVATAANAILNALVIPRWSYQGAVRVAIFTQILLCTLLRGLAWRFISSTEARHKKRGTET